MEVKGLKHFKGLNRKHVKVRGCNLWISQNIILVNLLAVAKIWDWQVSYLRSETPLIWNLKLFYTWETVLMPSWSKWQKEAIIFLWHLCWLVWWNKPLVGLVFKIDPSNIVDEPIWKAIMIFALKMTRNPGYRWSTFKIKKWKDEIFIQNGGINEREMAFIQG